MARTLLSAAACFLVAAPFAVARSIAVNYMAESWGGGPFPLASSETAGVFPQQWWNNADVVNHLTDVGGTSDIVSPQAGIFVDDQGLPTNVTMTWRADKDAGSNGAAGTADERLMKGFLEGYGRLSATGYAVRVEVANVPYDRYTVVPYLIGFGFSATASVRIGAEQYYYVQSSNFTTDGYIQATATSLANAQTATYAVFENQTGDSFTLDVITELGNRGALAGLQIIATSPGPLTGDFNLDGSVDAADYVVWRKHLGNVVPRCAVGDANCNGFVENGEYDTWKASFGGTLAGDPVPSESFYAGSSFHVPEPPTLLACALAIVLATGAGRRCIRHASRSRFGWPA